MTNTSTTPAIPPETAITDADGETCPVMMSSLRGWRSDRCDRPVAVAFAEWQRHCWSLFAAVRLCRMHASHERRKRANALERDQFYYAERERAASIEAQRRAQERLYGLVRARLGLGDDADVVAMLAAWEAPDAP